MESSGACPKTMSPLAAAFVPNIGSKGSPAQSSSRRATSPSLLTGGRHKLTHTASFRRGASGSDGEEMSEPCSLNDSLETEVSQASPRSGRSSTDRSLRHKAFLEDKRRQKEKKNPSVNRGASKGRAIGQSFSKHFSERAGSNDARKEKEEEEAPQEKFLAAVRKMRGQYVRSLGWLLGTHYWDKAIHTHSWAISELLQQFREAGYLWHLNDTPHIILGGDCPCELSVDIPKLGPTSWGAHHNPYFDQELQQNFAEDRPYVAHRDADHCLYTTSTHLTERWREDRRFSEREVPAAFARKVWPDHERQLHGESAWLFDDKKIRSLIKGTRVFAEVTFGTNCTAILTHDQRATYCQYQPDYLNAAVLCCFHENARLYRERVSHGDRRYAYDDKLTELASGVSIGSKGVSSSFIRDWWNMRIEPVLQDVKNAVQNILPQTPSEQHDPEPPAEPPMNDAKLEEPDLNLEPIPEADQEPSSEAGEEIATLLPWVQWWATEIKTLGLRALDATAEHCLPAMPALSQLDLPWGVRNLEQFDEVASELIQRDMSDCIFVATRSTNLFGRGAIHIDMQLRPELPDLFEVSGFTPGPMCVTWQEHAESTESGIIPFSEYGPLLEYDQTRVEIETVDETPMPVSSFSEVYYGVYWLKACCYGQDAMLIALKTRLGRSIKPGRSRALTRFRLYTEQLQFPKLELEHEDPIIDRCVYEEYLAKMPPSSRKTHLTYFDKRASPAFNLEQSKFDSSFVKFDEVLLDKKRRMIINPPPSLFYTLVTWTTACKKALKRQMFHRISDTDDCTIYFTYGADMDHVRKSEWFSAAYRALESCHVPTFYVLVGGDDNLVLYKIGKTIRAWESDVTACDQSHNRDLTEAMLASFGEMGVPDLVLQEWRASYLRPLFVKGRWKVFFKKPQLHTGHPHTSLANSKLVGMIAVFLCAVYAHAKKSEFFCQSLETFMGQKAEELGMIWKVQRNANPLDSTFHKGFWVPCKDKHYDFQWLPLPSCIWKATKIRTDNHIGHKEILLRLAFNQYQRILSPNTHLVRDLCKRQFEYIIRMIMPEVSQMQMQHWFDQPQSKSFENYRKRIGQGKNGEVEDFSPSLSWDEEPWWSVEAEDEFVFRRYGLMSSDLTHFADTWDGCFGTFPQSDVLRWVCRDYGANQAEYESKCESVSHAEQEAN